MLHEVKYYYLKNHNLSGCLNEDQLIDLCNNTRFKTYAKGESVYFGEDSDSKIFFLLKGKIKVMEIDDLGRELVKEIINEGDFFGAIGLQAEPPIDEFAVALTDNVTICSFAYTDFESILNKYPVLALTYVKNLSGKLRRLENRHSELVFKDVRARLISFFKDWAKREGNRQGNKVVLKNYLTHSDIAGFIATSRQSVTQLLNELRETGFLFYNRKQIEINDIALLN
jgi:CRP/FNR family transcriptional regulator, cyclic AMP receptor protein